jgi:hypothetical protein
MIRDERIVKNIITGLLALAILGMLLISCNDDDPDRNATATAEVTLVSMYYGSPDAPSLDIQVDYNQINPIRFTLCRLDWTFTSTQSTSRIHR